MQFKVAFAAKPVNCHGIVIILVMFLCLYTTTFFTWLLFYPTFTARNSCQMFPTMNWIVIITFLHIPCVISTSFHWIFYRHSCNETRRVPNLPASRNLADPPGFEPGPNCFKGSGTTVMLEVNYTFLIYDSLDKATDKP